MSSQSKREISKVPRFYVPPENVAAHRVRLTPNVVQHGVATLRMREGDKLILFDGTGVEYACVLRRETGRDYSAQIEQTRPGRPEALPPIFLYQAPLRKERWEWLIEKAAELGASAMIPLLTEHSEIDFSQNFGKKKERWEAIIQSACEQCDRSILPKILPPVSFEEALRTAQGARLLFYEGSAEPVKSFLARLDWGHTPARESFPDWSVSPESLSVFIGPTGGFSPEEVDLARSLQVPLVSLGTHVLRAETAGLAALAVLRTALQENS